MKTHPGALLVFLLFSSLAAFNVSAKPAAVQTAYFAGGCFWCVEAAYQDVPGVIDVISGFTGGKLKNPTYRGNHVGHYEAVEVKFDPETITYEQLLALFWHNIDPFDSRGQFCDKGPSYRAAIFYTDTEQKKSALKSRAEVVDRFPDQKVVTEILPATEFWPVEAAHQDYYLKNPVRYKLYRYSCRRDNRLQAIWGEEATH